MANFLDSQNELRSKVSSAMAYPILIGPWLALAS